MNKFVGFVLLIGAVMPVSAQRLLTLDSCRAMALRNNKQMGISKVKQEVAMNVRKSARTKYLPHVSALGTYQFTSKQLELLSDDQKSTLNNLGTSTVADLQSELNPIASSEPMQHIKAVLSALGLNFDGLHQMTGQGLQNIAAKLNGLGENLVDALDTDTRNLFAATVMVVQPVYMGGSLIALNKMADINEEMQQHSADARRQSTIYNIDKAYW